MSGTSLRVSKLHGAGNDFLVTVVIAFLEVVLANPHAWRLILLPTEGTPEMVREHVARGRAGVARTLEEFRAELYSASFDTRRLGL